MVRYKMVARDFDANPTQYRTWVVSDTPDFTAQYYTGKKSGNAPLMDVIAYAINDNNAIVDFNLPQPDSWVPGPVDLIKSYPILKTLPGAIEGSQLLVFGEYVYMFGGNLTSKIYRANISNPADWVYDGYDLPTKLYGASLAVMGGTDGYSLYLLGGNDGYGSVNTIFTASWENPLVWSSTGSHLPSNVQYASFGMHNGTAYLFGGLDGYAPSNHILRASNAAPLVWTDTGNTIPIATYGSAFAEIDGYWKVYGGLIGANTPTNVIWTANVADPSSWVLDGYLPYLTSFSTFVPIGNMGYIIGPMFNAPSTNTYQGVIQDNPTLNITGFTPIIKCFLNVPNVFTDTLQIVPATLSNSQMAIIADRIWFFGGNGQSAIFACNQSTKYSLADPLAVSYGAKINNLITQLNTSESDFLDNPCKILGIPWWLTDYLF